MKSEAVSSMSLAVFLVLSRRSPADWRGLITNLARGLFNKSASVPELLLPVFSLYSTVPAAIPPPGKAALQTRANPIILTTIRFLRVPPDGNVISYQKFSGLFRLPTAHCATLHTTRPNALKTTKARVRLPRACTARTSLSPIRRRPRNRFRRAPVARRPPQR